MQRNDYDCGVWVLSSIAAVLRGFNVTGLDQEEIPWFRHFLLMLVLAQPSK